MSLFGWLFRKPAPQKPPRAAQEPPGGQTGDTVPQVPGRAAPAPADAAAQRKNERMERRELLYTAVREAMVRASVLSASYKFKVLSLDQRGRQFLVMIDLAREYGGDTARLSEIEALIAQMAKARFDIFVTAVYWRISEHVAVGQPRPAATAPTAAAAGVPPRRLRPALPVPPQAPAPGADPIEADEIAAFQRALAQSAAPPAPPLPRRPSKPAAPTGFEDTQVQDPGETADLGRTQYGELK
ncbi:MAG: hypothetical protein QM740_07285 [Acidovorax sp.]